MTEVVELTYGELTPVSLAEATSDPTRIRALDLSGNNISGGYCVELAEKYIARMTNLQSLDIKDNSIGPAGATRLFEVLLEHCPKLNYLDVNENAIQDESMYALAVLLQGSALETLHVVTNHITPRGLPTLCDGLLASRTIRELSLAFNVLGDEGAVMVADMLGGHPTLRALSLSDNNITDAGAVALASAFVLNRNSHLEQLDLSVNRIGDIGFQAMSEALADRHGNSRLVHVDVGCNPVGDTGRAALASFAARMRYVQSIDLTSCDLSDDVALELARAIASSSSSLMTIEWFNNPRMSLEAEKTIFDAIQLKASVEEAKAHGRASKISTVGMAAAAIGLTTAALVVASMQRSRAR